MNNSLCNIWRIEGFRIDVYPHLWKPLGWVLHFGKCLKYSYQRVTRGYADCDIWCMCDYLSELIPEMLIDLNEGKHGVPGDIACNYSDVDDADKEWSDILDKSVEYWRESYEDTSSVQNKYSEEFENALEEFSERFGYFGEALRTEQEIEKEEKTGIPAYHGLREIPEYREICERYYQEEKNVAGYRMSQQGKALEMFKKYFHDYYD